MAPAFKIILKYCGYFEGDLELEYKEGFETNLEVSDVDYLCYVDLIDMIREADPILKGMMIMDVFYCVPGMSMSEGLNTIKLDNDVMEMVVHGLKSGMVQVFVTLVAEDFFTSKVNSPQRRQKLEVRRALRDGDEDGEKGDERGGGSDSEGDEGSNDDSTGVDSFLSGGISSEDDEEWYHSREKN
ncbi:hypothetical protein V2J09_016207 [Rumex salicifolius]